MLADTVCCGQNAKTVAARPGWQNDLGRPAQPACSRVIDDRRLALGPAGGRTSPGSWPRRRGGRSDGGRHPPREGRDARRGARRLAALEPVRCRVPARLAARRARSRPRADRSGGDRRVGAARTYRCSTSTRRSTRWNGRSCGSCGRRASCSRPLVGGMLAVAGSAYQGVFRNPLADPYLLGVAAGAGLGATLAIAYASAGARTRPAAGRGVRAAGSWPSWRRTSLGRSAGAARMTGDARPRRRDRDGVPDRRRRRSCSSSTRRRCSDVYVVDPRRLLDRPTWADVA